MKRGTVRRVVGLAVIAAAIAAAAGTATAGAATASSCPSRTLTQAFLPFGDANQYFLAPNGGFESGFSGWSYGGGASVVWGNESSYLNSRYDTKSAYLPAGGWVKTQTICTNPNDQTIRLMVKGTSGQLKVDAYILSGGNIRTWSTQIDGKSSTGWRPSQIVQFALGNQYLGDTTIQLTFTAIGATWQVDDLYIDPFLGY
jgi:hypothetical protein